MKMIIRTLCAAALVLGAVSLTGCGDKGDKANGTNDAKKGNATQTQTQGGAQTNKTAGQQ